MSKVERVSEFVRTYGVACGGNWGQMLMEAIKNGLPEVYAQLDDNAEYSFAALLELIEDNLPKE